MSHPCPRFIRLYVEVMNIHRNTLEPMTRTSGNSPSDARPAETPSDLTERSSVSVRKFETPGHTRIVHQLGTRRQHPELPLVVRGRGDVRSRW